MAQSAGSFRPGKSSILTARHRARTGGQDAGLLNVLAPRRNAAAAAGLLMRQSSMSVETASNQTNPSSPYERIPANKSAIFAGWPVAGVAAVSAMSIGSPVSARTAEMVGPNNGENFQVAL